MSPTSYRTAPPRVTDWNTHRNTTPDRRSSCASGARHQATPHDRGRELPRHSVRNPAQLANGYGLERLEREWTLGDELLEPPEGHLVQPALEDGSCAVAL